MDKLIERALEVRDSLMHCVVADGIGACRRCAYYEHGCRYTLMLDSAKVIERLIKGAYGYVDAKQIADAPTVDAVEIVRCRDCKHHRDKNEYEKRYLVEDALICTSPDATEDCWNAVWPDHFCSCGIQKDGDEND